MKFFNRRNILLVLAVLFLFNHPGLDANGQSTGSGASESEGHIHITDIGHCLKLAFENNRRRMISMAAVEIAEAQHRQSLSGYWPQLKMIISASRMDDDPSFIFPEETTNYKISGISQTPLDTTVTVPQKDVKIMDRDMLHSSLDLTWPIYTGGKRHAVSKQAELGIEIARTSAVRTDLQIVFDVKKMYYGCIFNGLLRQRGEQTYQQFQATLDITQQLYSGGAGSVKKTDYLRTRAITSMIRSIVEMLISNEKMAMSALCSTAGLAWNTTISLSENELPFHPLQLELDDLVTRTWQFNPDWKKMEFALDAALYKLKEARSGHLPVIALTGKLVHIDNAYDAGIMSERNRDSYRIGIGLELPIFSGFLTENRISEAKARISRLKTEKFLLKQGLALQVKNAYLEIISTQKQVSALKDALDSAVENRDLNVRAYQNELVQTREVIEAQLMEAVVYSQYIIALYRHLNARAALDFIVGTHLNLENVIFDN